MKAILIFGGILILIPIVFLILLANGWIAFLILFIKIILKIFFNLAKS